jgi:hypothetical protein
VTIPDVPLPLFGDCRATGEAYSSIDHCRPAVLSSINPDQIAERNGAEPMDHYTGSSKIVPVLSGQLEAAKPINEKPHLHPSAGPLLERF